MADTLIGDSNPGRPTIYRIRVEGHVDDQWSDWFEGLTVTLEDNGETLLTGPVADQAALHGLLRHVRDLSLPLLAVERVDIDPKNGDDSGR